MKQNFTTFNKVKKMVKSKWKGHLLDRDWYHERLKEHISACDPLEPEIKEEDEPEFHDDEVS